jgi:hypothetical protein
MSPFSGSGLWWWWWLVVVGEVGEEEEEEEVCSPQSESCVAMERRSRAAVSWADTRLLADLMRR